MSVGKLLKLGSYNNSRCTYFILNCVYLVRASLNFKICYQPIGKANSAGFKTQNFQVRFQTLSGEGLRSFKIFSCYFTLFSCYCNILNETPGCIICLDAFLVFTSRCISFKGHKCRLVLLVDSLPPCSFSP